MLENSKQASKVKLMMTNSDEEMNMMDETTKNCRQRGISRSDQKDVRNRRDVRQAVKVSTAGPSPMSFANMIDELIDNESDGFDVSGAPSRQMLFVPLEN